MRLRRRHSFYKVIHDVLSLSILKILNFCCLKITLDGHCLPVSVHWTDRRKMDGQTRPFKEIHTLVASKSWKKWRNGEEKKRKIDRKKESKKTSAAGVHQMRLLYHHSLIIFINVVVVVVVIGHLKLLRDCSHSKITRDRRLDRRTDTTSYRDA